jgi:hypothetical protein
MLNGEGGAVISGYGYDEFGNRATWNNAGVIVIYQYYDNGCVESSTWTEGSDAWTSSWAYDNERLEIESKATRFSNRSKYRAIEADGGWAGAAGGAAVGTLIFPGVGTRHRRYHRWHWRCMGRRYRGKARL